MHEVEALNGFYSSWDYAQRLQLGLTVFVVLGSYLHFLVRRLTPGWVALAASAPICLINLFLPLLFSNRDEELLSRGICIIAAPFLGNLKVWCCWQRYCWLQLSAPCVSRAASDTFAASCVFI
jgi:hypothetical protein